jgi:hypothetical protein
VGFFVTAVVTLGVVLFGGGTATGGPQPVRTVEKIVEKVVYRDRIVERASSSDKGAGESEDRLSDDRSGTSRSGRKSRGKKRNSRDAVDDETKALMAQLGVDTPTEGAPVGGRATKRESSRETRSGGTLSSGQMQSVVNQNKSSLKSCYERSLKKGEAPHNRDLKVIFKVTVGGSGTVRKVSLGGEANQLSSLRRCLTRSVDKWVFPSSSGESRLEFPFVFTPTR